MFLGLGTAACNNSCLDVLALGLMGLCSSQIEILNHKLVAFRNDKTIDGTESEIDNLKQCVKHHNKIIE